MIASLLRNINLIQTRLSLDSSSFSSNFGARNRPNTCTFCSDDNCYMILIVMNPFRPQALYTQTPELLSLAWIETAKGAASLLPEHTTSLEAAHAKAAGHGYCRGLLWVGSLLYSALMCDYLNRKYPQLLKSYCERHVCPFLCNCPCDTLILEFKTTSPDATAGRPLLKPCQSPYKLFIYS